ncbi:MAG TPA: DUF2071 domain-containing protein [Terriglobales bacterium]
MIKDVLAVTAHRPWALPDRPWIMFQRWNDLMFAHWALEPQQVRPLVPQELELDLFDGRAWVAIAPFWMSNVHVRGLPPLPGSGSFPEMNLRTYVRLSRERKGESKEHSGLSSGAKDEVSKPGVYFFSLDAGSLQAVLAARLSFGLPYFWARMSVKTRERDQIEYSSARRQRPVPADVKVSYGPDGTVIEKKSELEVFLTERYCLYVVRRGVVYRAQIHHVPWPLQPADAEFKQNTLAAAHGLTLSEPPHVLHFSKKLDVLIFGPEKVG